MKIYILDSEQSVLIIYNDILFPTVINIFGRINAPIFEIRLDFSNRKKNLVGTLRSKYKIQRCFRKRQEK